jgi:uncharacterized protein (DUF1330 family)
LLWAVEGQDAALSEYENTVLALIPRHGGRVVSRLRRTVDGDGPLEVQVIRLPDEAALEAYMQDPVRTALAPVHRTAVARTEVFRSESLQ